mgnify:CR=1 FL=1
MKIIYELRVPNANFQAYFNGFKSKPLPFGDVHKVLIDADDPRIEMLREAGQHLWEQKQDYLFYGWSLNHQCSQQELDQADLLGFQIGKVFEQLVKSLAPNLVKKMLA